MSYQQEIVGGYFFGALCISSASERETHAATLQHTGAKPTNTAQP